MNKQTLMNSITENFEHLIEGVQDASTLTSEQKTFIVEMLKDQMNIELISAEYC